VAGTRWGTRKWMSAGDRTPQCSARQLGGPLVQQASPELTHNMEPCARHREEHAGACSESATSSNNKVTRALAAALTANATCHFNIVAKGPMGG
jgi:hypothetical protein